VRKWNLIRAQPLNRNRSSMDQSIYRDRLSTKSWQKWICRGVVEDSSTAKTLRWIENLSARQSFSMDQRSCRDFLLRRTPEISMEWNCVNFCREKKKNGLDRKESVEDLSRSCSSLKKRGFSKRGKTQGDECNKHDTQPKIQTTD